MVCDFAEYYHITNYRSIPAQTVYTLVLGLREGSRLISKVRDRNYTTDQILMAHAIDRLSILCWQGTKDAQHNRNRPQSLIEIMTEKKTESDVQSFDSPEDFERYRQGLLNHE